MKSFKTILNEKTYKYKQGDKVEVTSNFGSAKQYFGKQGIILSVQDNYVMVKIKRAKSPEIEFNNNEIKLI